MRGLKLTLDRPPPNHSLGPRGLSCSKGLIQGTFRQLVRPLFRPQLPREIRGRGRSFNGSAPEGIPISDHVGELLLQLLDPYRQRGELRLGRGRLDLRVGTAKAEVLHLRASHRQKLVSVDKKALLPLKLVLDAPLLPEKDRLPEGLGLELLRKQNRGRLKGPRMPPRGG